MNYFLCDFQTFRKTTRTSSRRKSQILYWSIFFSQTMKIYPNNNHCCCTLNLRSESIFCNVPTDHHNGPRSDSIWKNCFVSLTIETIIILKISMTWNINAIYGDIFWKWYIINKHSKYEYVHGTVFSHYKLFQNFHMLTIRVVH